MIMSRQQLRYSLQNRGEWRKGQPATVLSEETLQSFAIFSSGEIGVSMMRSTGKEFGLMPSCSYASSNFLPDQKIKMRNCLQKNYTSAPYNDGYQWRKYGEKKISGSSFPRSYYRCTYREDKGCQATKQVQQQGHGDPPLFLVTSKGEHTCSKANMDDPHPRPVLQSYQLKQDYSSHDHRRNCNHETYSNSNYIPTTSSHTAHQVMVVDFPPDPESPFDFDFLHFDQPQGLITSDGGSCKNVSSPESSTRGLNPNLTPADFTAFCDEFHGSPSSQEFGGMDEEMMMEPLAFEFADMELFQILN